MYQKIVELIDAGTPCAALLVLSAQGSTPQGAGTRAIVEQSGRLWGTVGGGAMEAKAQQMAVEACQSQRPCIFSFAMTNADAADEGAVCGGRMRVLIDPTVARHRECYDEAARALKNRARGCLVAKIYAEPEMHVEVEWHPEPSMPASTTNALAEVFVEPVLPPPLLVVVGGGHVGRTVAVEAARVGFDVTLIDDRPEFAAAALFPPGIHVLCGPVAEQIAACPLDADSFVVLATRGHLHDSKALAVCIHRPLAYLGMIGSRRKVALVRKNFLETGLATEEEFDRVFAPIGLEIGAVTVPEIAVSIVAQLIAVRRKAASA